MALTTGSLLASCASICAVFVFGAFLPARSPVRRGPLLLCLLPRHLCHRPLLMMLHRLPRIRPRLPKPLLMKHMSSRYLIIQRRLVPTERVWLSLLSGVMRMRGLLLFSPRVFSRSLLLSSWTLLLLLRCGPSFVSTISLLVILSIYLCCVRSMIFSRITLLLMSSTPRVLRFGTSSTPSAVLSVVLASVAGQYVQIWISRGSMSSCLDFV